MSETIELKYDLKRREMEKKAELLEAEQWQLEAKQDLEELKKEKKQITGVGFCRPLQEHTLNIRH